MVTTEAVAISIPEAARRLGVNANWLYQLARQGDFPPAVKVGHRWVVGMKALERYVNEGGDAGRDDPQVPTMQGRWA